MTAAKLVAAQQHGPGGAAHLVILALVAVIALVVFGVSKWRGRRASATAEQQSHAPDHSAESTRTKE